MDDNTRPEATRRRRARFFYLPWHRCDGLCSCVANGCRCRVCATITGQEDQHGPV